MCFISVFASLFCIPEGITSASVGQKKKNAAGTKKYKSTIKKKRKKHNKIALPPKTRFNTVKVSISQS